MFARPGLLALLAVLWLTQIPIAIAQPGPSVARVKETYPAVVSLIVHPLTVRLDGARSEQHLTVTGQTRDGTTVDLTRDVVYHTTVPSVASVDSRGTISAIGDGDGDVT